MSNTTNNMKSEFKSKVNGATKSAKGTFEDAMDSAPEVLEKVTEFGKTFINSMTDSKEKVYETATQSLESLSKTLKERPWTFVGGAAALGFVAGFLMGRGRSPESRIMSGIDRIKDKVEKNINKVSEHLQ